MSLNQRRNQMKNIPWEIRRGNGIAGVYYYTYTEEGVRLESAYEGVLIEIRDKEKQRCPDIK